MTANSQWQKTAHKLFFVSASVFIILFVLMYLFMLQRKPQSNSNYMDTYYYCVKVIAFHLTLCVCLLKGVPEMRKKNVKKKGQDFSQSFNTI